MPQKYRVTSPEGQTYEVEMPDEAPLNKRVASAVKAPFQAGGALEPAFVGHNLAEFGRGIGDVAPPGPAAMFSPATLADELEAAKKEVAEKGLLGTMAARAKALIPRSVSDVVKLATGVNPSETSIPRKGGQIAGAIAGFMAGGKKFGTRGFGGGGGGLIAEAAKPKGSGFLGGISDTGANPSRVPIPAPRMVPGTFSRPTGVSTAPFGKVARALAKESATADELAALAKGGVQNDFRGRVHIEKPTELPSSPSGVRGEASPAKPVEGPLGEGTTTEANAKHRMEAAAENAGRTEPPGREPVYGGPERRGPNRPVLNPNEDNAYAMMRRLEEEKNLAARQGRPPKVMAMARPTKPTFEGISQRIGQIMKRVSEPNVPDAEWDALTKELKTLQDQQASRFPQEMAAREVELEASRKAAGGRALSGEKPVGVGAKKGALEGFTRQPTKSLEQMVEQYGKEGAAQRSGMSVPELEVRLEAGSDPAKLAKGLRDRLGAEKAGRILGMSAEEVRKVGGGGPSKLPQAAVDRIKASAAKEMAEHGKLSEKTQLLMNRIKSEGGRVPVKALIAGGLPIGGAVAGSMLPAEDSDATLGNTILGGLGGAALGAGMFLPWRKALPAAIGLRREMLLSGLAEPKNMVQMIGNALWASGENLSTKPLKELFRLPANVREYIAGMRQADPYTYSTLENYGSGAGKSKLRFFQPSHRIASIDRADTAMLRRSGVVPESDIPRYMMNANEDVLQKIVNHPVIPEHLRPLVKLLARIPYPFTRFATNLGAGTAAEGAHLLHSIAKGKPNMRALMGLGSIGGGAALGSWAGNDPRRLTLAGLALPLFGPGQGLAAIGGAGARGLRGMGAGAFGLSPLPEQGLNPAQFWNKEQWFGFKPAFLNAYKKLAESK